MRTAFDKIAAGLHNAISYRASIDQEVDGPNRFEMGGLAFGAAFVLIGIFALIA